MRRQDPLARALEKIEPEPNSGCWIWIGTRVPKGYGRFWVGPEQGPALQAYRFIYESLRGPIPDGLVLDHLCRNPPCVNPAHLRVVSNRDNILAGTSLIADNARKELCMRGHNNWVVLAGRWGPRRDCLTCRTLRSKEGRRRLYPDRRRPHLAAAAFR